MVYSLTNMSETFKKTIVIGVDPAPSKGLCVYVDYGDSEIEEAKKFKRHYKATSQGLEEFVVRVKELQGKHTLLICWDAPLTMPSGKVDFYTRDIEAYAKSPNGTLYLAPVLAAAGCSHWTISQALLNFPRLARNGGGGQLEDVSLVFYPHQIKEKKISLVEVHPALAIQLALGRDKIWTFGKHGQLSGKSKDGTIETYKNVRWNNLKISGFADLVKSCQTAFKGDRQTPALQLEKVENRTSKDPDPADHLDAWIAMRLGRLWLFDNGRVRVFGNEQTGSFLLPTMAFSNSCNRELTIFANRKKIKNRINPFLP